MIRGVVEDAGLRQVCFIFLSWITGYGEGFGACDVMRFILCVYAILREDNFGYL